MSDKKTPKKSFRSAVDGQEDISIPQVDIEAETADFSSPEITDTSKDSIFVPEADKVNQLVIKQALRNSRLATFGIVISILVCLYALFVNSYANSDLKQVAAIPNTSIWEYPLVHWVNSPDQYSAKAKPLFVAQKYIAGLYEIDPTQDFDEVKGEFDSKVMLSNSIAELLAYTVPQSAEYIKINQALTKSYDNYRKFNECRCRKRFLIDDMLVTQGPLPRINIQVIGRFVIMGVDGQQPLPAEDLGYKSISIWLAQDLPIFDRSGTGNPKPLNPEGWYVVDSSMTTLFPKDLIDLKNIRQQSGMKAAY